MLESEQDIAEIYHPNGPLSQFISGYTYREQQMELAQKIMDTIADKKILLAEAGTGTGKTLAYLIPAMLSPGTFLISTGTKNLQNQLFLRDLPLVQKALRMPISAALLKGRANYLCKYRLELALTDILLASSEMLMQFKQIMHWAESTDDGDISTLADIPEDASIWGYVTSTNDNCLGHDCPFINSCFLYKARAAALEAKIIVVNHHLLFSDWGIKQEKMDAKLLPDGVNLIIDEAHQVSHIATLYFGSLFSSKKIKLLIQDIYQEHKANAADVKQILDGTKALNYLLEDLQQYLATKPERGFYNHLSRDKDYQARITKFADELENLNEILKAHQQRSKGLESCAERASGLCQDLEVFLNPNLNHDAHILWYEIYKQTFIFKKSPLEIKQLFSQNLEQTTRSCILTSATVSVAGKFDLIKSELGLEQAETLKIPSPFEYKTQAVLYIPRGMPDPMADNYNDCLVQQILPVLEYSKGKAFLLFTSFNAMYNAHEKFLNQLTPDHDFNVLLQGKDSKTSLLNKFREMDNAILFATASFWEGIDVKGSDLHCVIIDKLPFASPSDPLLQARINHLRSQGKNPFLDLQCQQAALQLVQGAGRLIRSEQDYGVLMICDPRIISRPYGELFINSLPDMNRTRSLSKIKDFYGQFSC